MKEDKYVTHRYVSSRAKGLLLESVGTYAKKIRSRGDGAEKIENHQVGKEKFCTLFFQCEMHGPLLGGNFLANHGRCCSHQVDGTPLLVLNGAGPFREAAPHMNSQSCCCLCIYPLFYCILFLNSFLSNVE